MAYGGGGRYWNVGLSDTGRLAATQKQIWMLQRLTGRDHSGRGLTRDAASEEIDKAIEERHARREGNTSLADQLFGSLLRTSVQRANEAGERWLAEHPEPLFAVVEPESGDLVGVHGEIGSAHVTWPRSRNSLWKWLAANHDDGQKSYITIPHRYCDRLERDLLVACEKAVFDHLRESVPGADIGFVIRSDGEPPSPAGSVTRRPERPRA